MLKLKLLFRYFLKRSPLLILASYFVAMQIKAFGFSFMAAGYVIKLFVLLLIFGIEWLYDMKREKFYFYYNQGITIRNLYSFTILVDFLLFILIIKLLWIF